MKKLLLVAIAFAVYTAFRKIGQSQPTPAVAEPPPVDELAHKLQDTWSSHHTVA